MKREIQIVFSLFGCQLAVLTVLCEWRQLQQQPQQRKKQAADQSQMKLVVTVTEAAFPLIH